MPEGLPPYVPPTPDEHDVELARRHFARAVIISRHPEIDPFHFARCIASDPALNAEYEALVTDLQPTPAPAPRPRVSLIRLLTYFGYRGS